MTSTKQKFPLGILDATESRDTKKTQENPTT